MNTDLANIPPGAVMPQAPTPCLARLDARPWHATLAVRTGPMLAGIRVDTVPTARRVEELLEPLRVPTMDHQVGANFSVELGDPPGVGSRRRLSLIYRDHEIVGRRRDPDALLLDLVELIDEVSLLGVTSHPIVHATGVISASGEATLLPGRHQKALLTRRQQLADRGLELLRTRTQQLDPTKSELILEVCDAGLSEVLGKHLDDRTSAGRFPLRAWCLPAVGSAPFDMSAAEGVFAAASTVLNRETAGMQQTLRGLSQVASISRFVGVPDLSPATLADTLLRTAC